MRWRTANAATHISALALVVALALALSSSVALGIVGAAPAAAQSADGIPTFTADEFVAFLDRVELPGTTGPGPLEAITGYGPADLRIIGRAEATDYRLRRRAAVPLTGATGVLLNEEASTALGQMMADAGAAGVPFAPVSGFRSVDDQRGIFVSKLVSEGFARIGRPYNLGEIANGSADAAIDEVLRLNSIPGYSFHHTGDTVDLAAPGQSLAAFAYSGAYAWLAADDYANARAHGFVPSYPVGASAIGPEPEPWEFTYVGLQQLQCAKNVLALRDVRPGRCPIGSLDVVAAAGSRVSISGWAADPDSPARPLTVDVYVDGVGAARLGANGFRPDVDAATGLGAAHGFSGTLELGPGGHQVCVYALNDVPGEANTALGCRTIEVRTTPPIGVVDKVAASGSAVVVEGWAADPDRPATALEVHVYVDGAGAAVLRATGNRPDVAAATGLGGGHGYSGRITVPGGSHEVCVYAISPQPGETNTQLGCRRVWALGPAPTGVLDVVAPVGRSVVVQGWALDADVPDRPVEVHVYVDGVGTAVLVASGGRPDVGQAFGVGSRHGFSARLATSDGRHTVCVHAIAVQAGDPNTLLGCRVVETAGDPPVGALDRVDPVGGGQVDVEGWAADPDLPAAVVEVHLYLDDRGVAVLHAGGRRPDVAAGTPFGPDHGFRALVAAGPGNHRLCAYGISPQAGEGNRQLGCRSFTL